MTLARRASDSVRNLSTLPLFYYKSIQKPSVLESHEYCLSVVRKKSVRQHNFYRPNSICQDIWSPQLWPPPTIVVFVASNRCKFPSKWSNLFFSFYCQVKNESRIDFNEWNFLKSFKLTRECLRGWDFWLPGGGGSTAQGFAYLASGTQQPTVWF